jgi:hypothetical protein
MPSFLLALAADPRGKGVLEPLASFKTNPAGAAIVSAVGPIRQVIRDASSDARRFLVIASGTAKNPGSCVQVQASGS